MSHSNRSLTFFEKRIVSEPIPIPRQAPVPVKEEIPLNTYVDQKKKTPEAFIAFLEHQAQKKADQDSYPPDLKKALGFK